MIPLKITKLNHEIKWQLFLTSKAYTIFEYKFNKFHISPKARDMWLIQDDEQGCCKHEKLFK